MANITIASPISGWLTRIESSRAQLIAAARSGSRIVAAFATADARVDLIESLEDESIRARLLRMTDPKIAMVELVNNPSDDDRIRVCGIAILSGFCPGEDQFSIFGAGRNKDGTPKSGRLYTKEAGFRTLFAHLGIVPEVKTTHPEYVKFGTAGKSIWRVGGSASCTHDSDVYSVDFSGDESLGITGYDSDNVAGVSAKARRRILQALWMKVSPILTSDHSAEDVDTVPLGRIAEAAAQTDITVERREIVREVTIKTADSFAEKWRKELTGIGKDAGAIAKKLFTAWQASDLAEVEKVIVEEFDSVLDQRDKDRLRLFADAIGNEISGEL